MIKAGRQVRSEKQRTDYIPEAIQEEIKTRASSKIIDLCRKLLPSEYIEQRPLRGSVTFARTKEGRTYTANVSGRYAGKVKDWRGENMDAVSLVREYGGARSYTEALQILADWCGIDTGINSTEEDREELAEKAREANKTREAKKAKEAEKSAKKTQAEEAKKKGYAAHYWNASQPVMPGSIADRYLTEVRGIARPSQGWPTDTIRFHSGDCALVAGISDDKGKVLTAQRIFLTPDGKRALETHEDGTVTKKQKKVLSGNRTGLRFRLPARTTTQQQENQRRIIAICEGPETALSIWTATGFETWATIGVSSRVYPPPGSLVIYCRDNESEGTQAYKAANNAAEQWTSSGCAVVTVWPWGEYSTRENQLKTDLNDALLAHGPEYVRRIVTTPINKLFAEITLHNPVYQQVSTSRKKMADQMEQWFAGGWVDSRETLISVDAGTGKTAGAIQAALKTFIETRIPGRPLVFSFPDHRLAEEKRAEIERAASEIGATLNIKVFKGREQIEANGIAMCENIEQAKEVQAAGMSASEYLCNAKNGNCPYRFDCPYVKQMQTSADIWLITHASLMINKPKNIGLPQFLIIDEPTLKNGLTGIEGKPRLISGIALPTRRTQGADQETIYAFKGWDMGEVESLANTVRTMLEKQAEGIEQNETRYLSKALASEYFGHVNLDVAIEQTNQALRRLKPDLQQIKKRTDILRALGRTAALLQEIKRLLNDKDLTESPRVILTTGKENELLYRLTGRKEISKLWLAPSENEANESTNNRTPILMLDATANLPLIKSFFPDIKIMDAIRAATPHARITLMQGQQWGFMAQKNAVKTHKEGKTERGDGQTIEGMRITLWRHWLRSGGKTTLAIMGKSLREYLEELNTEKPGFLPPGCDLAHFGATRGLNKWEEVGTILVFGRMLIPHDKLQMQAEAMTGKPVMRQNEQAKITKTRILPDGRSITLNEYSHPDETVNAFLKASVDGETIQAIGRGRAVNRKANNPLNVYIYADTFPDGLPLDDVQQSSAITPWERMALNEAMNSGGESKNLMPVLTAPGDAAKAFPSIWGSQSAGVEAFKCKNISGGNLYNNIYIGLPPSNIIGPEGVNQNPIISGLIASCGGYIVRYKPAGKGQQWRFAWVPEEWRDGFHNWIAQALSVAPDAVSLEWVEYDLPELPSAYKTPVVTKLMPPEIFIRLQEHASVLVQECQKVGTNPLRLFQAMRSIHQGKGRTHMYEWLNTIFMLSPEQRAVALSEFMPFNAMQQPVIAEMKSM